MINLTPSRDERYHFVNWIGDVDNIADASDATATIIMNGEYAMSANLKRSHRAGGASLPPRLMARQRRRK